jgi:hypothetical protein
METTGTSLADYLSLLRNHRRQVLARGLPSETDTPVTRTWTLALEAIAETTPSAVNLLRLLAFMAPEDIPFRRLLAQDVWSPGDLDPAARSQLEQWRTDRFALDDAVAALRRHSLIGSPADGRVYCRRRSRWFRSVSVELSTYWSIAPMGGSALIRGPTMVSMSASLKRNESNALPEHPAGS